ncbi:hypothetical protein SDC9_81634 [bioreactor metagenome]|uniref:Uncharacterized protein n=1 Tax=bioreactor metagenome TaxID=1076179 RepID=A0A644ZAX9_9ZZZZ
MLLGALGYDGVQEGFTGSGWTMNVAKLGNTAGLFNDFATAFSGNAGVTREQACLLALNTLKATEVQYTGGTNITTTTGNATTNVSTQKERSYVTSNNTKINANIKGQDQGNTSAYLTLQFGEEHFADLKLVQGTVSDSFGRPSNQWNYKNVKVGTYAKTADFTFTTTASGDTAADKVKDMGIKDYTVASGVKAIVNGATGASISSVTDIPALMGKGTLVQLYISDTTANQITDVVVVRTQLMQVNAVKSDSVTLKKVESTGVAVAAVKDGDDTYKALSGLKADDYVLVVPVEDTIGNYIVDSVSIPQSVTGKLSKITLNSTNDVTGISVADTAYKMSALWSSEDGELKANTSLTSNKEATAYLDTYGFAIYVKNVIASNSVIVIDEIYSSLVDGKIVKTAKGWDTNGNALSLNLGTATVTAVAGDVCEYAVTTSNNAEYVLLSAPSALVKTTAKTYVQAGDTRLDTNGSTTGGLTTEYFDSNVKFLFVSKDSSDDVTGITVKAGVSEVGSTTDTSKQYALSYVLNKDKDKIIAVVVPNDDDAAVTANLIYISKVEGYQTVDGTSRSVFTAYIDGVKTEGCIASKNNAAVGFFTYSKNDSTGVYTLSSYTQKATKATSVLKDVPVTSSSVINKTYIPVASTITGTVAKELNAKNATVIDLTESGKNYASLKDMVEDTTTTGFTVSLVYNDSTNTGAGTVSYVYVTARTAAYVPVVGGKYSSLVDQTVTAANGLSNLDMSSVAYSINSSYAITMNVAAGVNLQTQVKEFLAYKGYTNIGNMSWVAAGHYEITATNPDGIVVTLTLAAPDNTNTYALVTVGTTKMYKVATTTVAGLTINSNDGKSYVKVTSSANTVSFELNNAATVVVNGSTYATDKFVAVTMDPVAGTPASLNGNTVTATVPANTFVKVGEKAIVTLGVTPADPAANVTASVTGIISATGATAASDLDSATEIIANNTAVIVAGKTSVEVTLTNNTAAAVALTLTVA